MRSYTNVVKDAFAAFNEKLKTFGLATVYQQQLAERQQGRQQEQPDPTPIQQPQQPQVVVVVDPAVQAALVKQQAIQVAITNITNATNALIGKIFNPSDPYFNSSDPKYLSDYKFMVPAEFLHVSMSSNYFHRGDVDNISTQFDNIVNNSGIPTDLPGADFSIFHRCMDSMPPISSTLSVVHSYLTTKLICIKNAHDFYDRLDTFLSTYDLSLYTTSLMQYKSNLLFSIESETNKGSSADLFSINAWQTMADQMAHEIAKCSTWDGCNTYRTLADDLDIGDSVNPPDLNPPENQLVIDFLAAKAAFDSVYEANPH